MDSAYVSSGKTQAADCVHTYIYNKRSLASFTLLFLVCCIATLVYKHSREHKELSIAQVQDFLIHASFNTIPNHPLSCARTSVVRTEDYSTTEKSPPANIIKQKEYTLINQEMNWFHALEYCFRDGKRLAIVENEEDNQQIVDILEENAENIDYVWIGASDIGVEGQFVWTATGQPVTWTHWYKIGSLQQPDNSDNEEHCVHMTNHSSWHWNDLKCSKASPFVCETILPDNP